MNIYFSECGRFAAGGLKLNVKLTAQVLVQGLSKPAAMMLNYLITFIRHFKRLS